MCLTRRLNKFYAVPFYIVFFFILVFGGGLYFSGVFDDVSTQCAEKILLVDSLNGLDDGFGEALSVICGSYGMGLETLQSPSVVSFREIEGDYSLVILRVHSTCKNNVTWIFTSEPYVPDRYILEQLAGEVHSAYVDYNSERVFVVGSYYIEHYLRDRISADCVILMGCNGAQSQDMGVSWVLAGSSYFVGWSGDVELSETDGVTLELIDAYLKRGVEEGLLDFVSSGVGDDASSLLIYPRLD